MAGPSETPKNEIRCKGRLKAGKRQGNPCRGLLVAEDGTIVCHNCGDPRHLLDVLGDAVRQRIVTKEVVMAAIEQNPENKEGKMTSVKGILEEVAELTIDEQKEVSGKIEALLSNKGIYPKKKVVEKDGYKVTVKWHGVFTDFVGRVAQAGDCKGEVIFETKGLKLRLRPKFGFYNRENNLDNYDEIYGRLLHGAENKNFRLEPKKLALVLAEALSPYSWWAKKRIEDMKIGLARGGSRAQ